MISRLPPDPQPSTFNHQLPTSTRYQGGSDTLQSNSNLYRSISPGYGSTITTANGTNNITITPPTGNLFFRLSNP